MDFYCFIMLVVNKNINILQSLQVWQRIELPEIEFVYVYRKRILKTALKVKFKGAI